MKAKLGQFKSMYAGAPPPKCLGFLVIDGKVKVLLPWCLQMVLAELCEHCNEPFAQVMDFYDSWKWSGHLQLCTHLHSFALIGFYEKIEQIWKAWEWLEGSFSHFRGVGHTSPRSCAQRFNASMQLWRISESTSSSWHQKLTVQPA